MQKEIHKQKLNNQKLITIINTFFTFVRDNYLLFPILFVAYLLRIYRLVQNFPFDGEVGDNLLDIKNYFVHHQIPLIGPPTSHSWLNFGPLFYWIYGPILVLSKFNPISHQYFAVAISLLLLIANYYYIQKLFSKFTAVVSSLLISISPMYLFITRLGRFIFIVPLLIYPFIWTLYKLIAGEKKYFFYLFLILGVMLNFHYTPLFLFPVIFVVLLVKKIKVTLRDIFFGVLGFVLPLLPLLIYDSQHKFSMLFNLLLWIPYRIVGFLGIYHKNTLTQQVLQENKLSIINFFSFSFTPTPYDSYTIVGIFIFFLLIIYILYRTIKFYKNKTVPNAWFILYIWMFFGFLALFIHGNVPLHYFVPLFPIPILLFSLLLSDFNKVKFGKFVTTCIILFLIISNISYYLWSNWYYQPEKTSPYTDGLISYVTREQIAQFIVKNANHRPYTLQRVGYNDFFAKQFAQNYLYLLWWYGNEPVNKAHVTYTIVESGSQISHILKKNDHVYIVRNVIILKRTL